VWKRSHHLALLPGSDDGKKGYLQSDRLAMHEMRWYFILVIDSDECDGLDARKPDHGDGSSGLIKLVLHSR
jgi:hypothetical protein